MHSDETLWEGLLRGNRDMFIALYRKYYHPLLFTGMKEIKDAQLVKDTIHQLFLYIWEKRASLDSAKNVRSYLVSSFRRKLSDDWKKSGRISSLQLVHSEYAEDSAPTPEESLIRKDEKQRIIKQLAESIHELPTRQRELIQLRFYEGLSYEEIVQQTGLSHRTVYNKIFEALRKLRVDIGQSRVRNASLFFLLGAFCIALLFFFRNG